MTSGYSRPNDTLTPDALLITPVARSAKIVTARPDGFSESVTYDAEGRVTNRVIAGEAKILSGSDVARNRALSDRVFAVVGVGLIAAAAILGLVPLKHA